MPASGPDVLHTTGGLASPGPDTCPVVEIRDARLDELALCQDLQRRVWGIQEDGYVVPVATMAAVQKVGGLVLVAEGEALVGFSFAFLGRVHGKLALYSQITAVEPSAQGRGVGRAIKQEQRRRAAEMGLDLVAWAFDPLQARNAAFNLGVLGATSRTYEVDLYGVRNDVVNAGLSTDRLLAEWSTREEEPRPRRQPIAVELIESVLAEAPLPANRGWRRPTAVFVPGADLEYATVEIPPDVGALKRLDLQVAREWQMAVRTALRGAFEAGFVAVGFARGQRPRYILERQAA